jgi:uncharacterized hydrophobic protein (TIGR00341 family)
VAAGALWCQAGGRRATLNDRPGAGTARAFVIPIACIGARQRAPLAMSLRIVEVVAPVARVDAVMTIAREGGAIDAWHVAGADHERATVKILVAMERCQTLIDAIESDNRCRIILNPVLATVPEQQPEAGEQEQEEQSSTAPREELYDSVAQGAQVDSTFILLTVLSTLVAAIGLLKDNVAVVIGAMVIAPLLGPNLAFAFGVALGDRVLMLRALRANLIGLSLTIGISVLAGLILPLDLSSHELVARTSVEYGSVALALASGAAAVLSLTSGLSSALVGVMVAVALLPPAATFGFMLGAGHFQKALGAATLLSVNLVCVNLAAQIVLVSRGIRPRTWWQKKEAQQSIVLNLAVWGILLMLLLGVIYVESVHPFQ